MSHTPEATSSLPPHDATCDLLCQFFAVLPLAVSLSHRKALLSSAGYLLRNLKLLNIYRDGGGEVAPVDLGSASKLLGDGVEKRSIMGEVNDRTTHCFVIYIRLKNEAVLRNQQLQCRCR